MIHSTPPSAPIGFAPQNIGLGEETKNFFDTLQGSDDYIVFTFNQGEKLDNASIAKLPLSIQKDVQAKQKTAAAYGGSFGEPRTYLVTLPSGNKIYAVAGIISDTVNVINTFDGRGEPLGRAVDGQGGYAYEP